MKEKKHKTKQKFTAAGIILTIAVTAGLVWAGMQWRDRYNWITSFSIEQIKANELAAYENVQLIVAAQTEYIKIDWDGDGKRTYARFLPHLWTSVDKNHNQVEVGLIDKKLGLAMDRSLAVDGYYFNMIYDRTVAATGNLTEKLDCQNQWAVTAAPVANKETGFLVFLTDSSGDIYVKNSTQIPQQVPFDAAASEWTLIKNIADFRAFQAKQPYPEK